jgi:signal transduction histidine kinase
MQEIREQERASLSRELHDELGQALCVARMDLRWIEKRLPKELSHIMERIGKLVDTVDNAIAAVQNISTALRHPAPAHPGLCESIRRLAKSFEESTEIECEIITEPKTIAMEEEICGHVFGIFREALTNIARHARAKKVTVRARRQTNEFLMVLSDDGRGIRKHEITDPRSLGLIGMGERAGAIGAQLTIAGVPGKGTTVTLTVPLKQPDVKSRVEGLLRKDSDRRTIDASCYYR